MMIYNNIYNIYNSIIIFIYKSIRIKIPFIYDT